MTDAEGLHYLEQKYPHTSHTRMVKEDVYREIARLFDGSVRRYCYEKLEEVRKADREDWEEILSLREEVKVQDKTKELTS